MNIKSGIREIYKSIEYTKQKKQYDKKYPAPPFDIWTPCVETAPPTYNSDGVLYKYFYFRDIHGASRPYNFTGKYFIWDRYNYGLPVHFYTHKEMLVNIGSPTRKFGMLTESRAIVPQDYHIFERNKGLEKEFEKIFTYDDELLNDVENAELIPFAATYWYGKNNGADKDALRYTGKSKNVSFLASNKDETEIHKMRKALAQYCNSNGLCDVYGKAVRNEYVDVETPLSDYRFSFAIENYQSDYYFTEKITSCFASQTIPIYFGARKISEYFNEDGIIVIDKSDFSDIEKVLKQCTIEEYERRIPAIIDNYNRTINNFSNIQDYLYENYLSSYGI